LPAFGTCRDASLSHSSVVLTRAID
jgi:hypothetical protein